MTAPVDEAWRAATGAWSQILDQVDGARVTSGAEAAAIIRSVTDALAPLTGLQLRTFAVLVATNLLASGEFIHTEPQFLRHLLDRAVKATPREDQT